MGNCEEACSAGAGHHSDLFSMQAQEGTVSNLVCYNKAFSTTTDKVLQCKNRDRYQEARADRVNAINLPLSPSQVRSGCGHICKHSKTCMGVRCLRTEIVHACERERDQV